MFGKNKVKGHNRLAKSKEGFKVIRVDDFFRKKDENRGKKIALGAGLLVGAGIGSALLLKKKAIKFPGSVSQQEKIVEKALLTKKSASPIKVIEETVGIPPKQKTVSGEKFVKQMDNEWGISKKKEFSRIEDPWETPILTKVQKGDKSNVVKVDNNFQKLLSPGKRGNIKKEQDKYLLNSKQRNKKLGVNIPVISDKAASIRDYERLPLPMKATLQMNNALLNPTKTSNLGRPPESTSLKNVLNAGDEKKVAEKVKRRLLREKSISEGNVKKKRVTSTKSKRRSKAPNPSRRKLLGINRVKETINEKDKIADLAISSVAERKSPMGLALQQISKIAKDPEAEKLGIQVKAEEWEKALATVTGRRGMISATGKGVNEAARSLAYARVVKPKIISTLMNEVKSGNLQSTNPKGYAERLKRIHDNFDELMKKEGVDYKKLSRRDLAKRVGKVMEPEIKEAFTKAKDWATSTTSLTDVFFENAQMQEAFARAGIKDKKAQFLMKMLMKVNGLG